MRESRIAKVLDILERGGSLASAAEEIVRAFEGDSIHDPLLKVGAAFPCGIHMYYEDPEGRLIFEAGNLAADRILGIDHQKFVGLTIEDAFPSLRGTEVPHAYRTIAREGGTISRDVFRYSGEEIAGVFEFSAFQVESGRMATFFRDATRERRATRLVELQRDLGFRLGASTSLTESLSLFLDTAIAASGLEAGAVAMYDAPNSRLLLAHSFGLTPPSVAAFQEFRFSGEIPGVLSQGEPFLRKTGDLPSPLREVLEKQGLISLALFPIVSGGKFLACLFLGTRLKTPIPPPAFEAVEDIAQRLGGVIAETQAHQALAESESRFRVLFDTVPVGIVVTRPDGTLVAMNQTLRNRFSSAESVPANVLRIYPNPQNRDHILETLRTEGTIQDFEIELRIPGDPPAPFSVSSTLTTLHGQPALITAVVDISERKQVEATRARLETQLRQAHKMEAVGRLAGGLAHDFNNILQAINGFTDLVAELLSPGDPAQEYLGEIQKASARGHAMVQQLLSVGHKPLPPTGLLHLEEVIDEALPSLSTLLPPKTDIRLKVDRPCPPILGEKNECHRVLMNLVTNAGHAMVDRPGVLEIGLTPFDVGPEDPLLALGLSPGLHLRWWIKDTGEGMDAATLSHVFEPFFTTKRMRAGTGMGLTVTHGIVKNHQGTINIQSERGQGTLVEMYFPAASVLNQP